MRVSERAARVLAGLFFCTTLVLGIALGMTWRYVNRLVMVDVPSLPALPPRVESTGGEVSPLLVHYQLDVPGRGEIFPALSAGQVSDYWPLAIMTIANTSDRPVVQTVSAEVVGWSSRVEHSFMMAPHETRKLPLTPDLLPAAYDNTEIRQASLKVEASSPGMEIGFSRTRPVYLHSALDLYWGKKFSNAQLVARWVTPHDGAVLRLVSAAKRYIYRGRLPGYDQGATSKEAMAREVRSEARAVFEALRRSGVTYVSSISTFGNFTGDTQRVRLPHETLALRTANCIDVSVAYASAMENIGLMPVIVVVPGHAFTGVKLGPQSTEILYLDLTVIPGGTFEAAIARANRWLKSTPAGQVLTVDVAAARALGIYPMPGTSMQAASPARAALNPDRATTTEQAVRAEKFRAQ